MWHQKHSEVPKWSRNPPPRQSFADAAAGKLRGAVPDDPLLTAAEAAAERGQAISTFWRDVRAGRVPPAYQVGPKCRRWRRSHIRNDLEMHRAAGKGVPLNSPMSAKTVSGGL